MMQVYVDELKTQGGRGTVQYPLVESGGVGSSSHKVSRGATGIIDQSYGKGVASNNIIIRD